MAIGNYIEKVKPIQAVQYKKETVDEVKQFLGTDRDEHRRKLWEIDQTNNRLRLYFRGAVMKADFGDWVFKDADERYGVVRETDFLRRYEPMSATKQPAKPEPAKA